MTTYSVSNDAQLAAAIAKVKGGDSILLAGGTYTKLNVLNMNFASNVTIASADATHPAIVKSMLIRGSSNISLSGLDLPASEAQGNYVFQVNSSSNISLDHLNVHGTEGKISNVSPFILRGSTNVTVTNSEFSYVQHGISQLDNNGLTLTGNSFHDIRTDGIRGGGSSNVLISNNYFTDFYPAPGDHPDAIQFWTTNTTAAASNITVTNNTFVRGHGEEAQGVFMRDEVGTLHYQNVTVAGNTIIGGMENGVAVGGVNGLNLHDNNVIALDGERSTIRVQDATNATVSDNHATAYVYINADTAVRDGNILVDSFSKSIASSVLSWAQSMGSASLIAKGITGMIGGLDHEIGYFDSPLLAASARSFAEIVVSGTAGADKLYASTIGASRVEGGAGNDVLTGNGLFEHQLIGGAGDDSYYVKGASDHVVEAPNGGNDTVISSISYTLGDNVENLRMAVSGLTGTGNELDNRITGSSGDDTLYGMGGNDTITGGDGNDKIYGGAGNDDLRGENGNDYLDGGDGNDILSGGAGNDTLIGGAGNDVLEGGPGSDTMTGGPGNDIFRFRQGDIGNGDVDKITDFTRGQDKIDLGAIDAKAGTSANDAFTFIGTNAFHNVAGELRYSVVNGDAVIQGDVNGDGKADFTIVAQHVTVLAATDFTL